MTSRNQSLDVLRGIAVIAIMLPHYQLNPRMNVGMVGVDLFFVLSGFLISGLLFSELRNHGKISLRRFWVRRGFKIYPAFFFFVGLTAWLFVSLRRYLPVELLFLQSYIEPKPTLWSHLWSLAVEEHFYFVLPILLVILARIKKLNAIPAIALALAVICLFLRWQYCERTQLSYVHATHLRLDDLFAGVALRYLYDQGRAWRSNYLLAAMIFIVPAFMRPSNAVEVAFTLTLNMIAFSSLLLWAVPRNLPGCGWLAEIGKHSYSIYLWQMVVSMFFHSRPLSLIGFAGYVVISCAIGVAMSLIVEMPMLAIRERFIPTRRSRNYLLPASADNSDSGKTAVRSHEGSAYLPQPAN